MKLAISAHISAYIEFAVPVAFVSILLKMA